MPPAWVQIVTTMGRVCLHGNPEMIMACMVFGMPWGVPGMHRMARDGLGWVAFLAWNAWNVAISSGEEAWRPRSNEMQARIWISVVTPRTPQGTA